MHLTVIASHRAPHQVEHQKAMAEGIKAIGGKVTLSFNEYNVRTTHVACWGWRVGRFLRERGHQVLVMERGYVGDRFSFTSLGWNGLNGYASFPDYPDDGGVRFRSQRAVLKPWKNTGDVILIMGQVPGDQSLRGQDLMPWYQDIAQQAHDMYRLPVLFRPHPDLAKKGIHQNPVGTVPAGGSLQECMHRAKLVVTYNSNSGVDALLAGVPVMCVDRGAMAYNLALHSLGPIPNEDDCRRTAWAYSLAWKQWSLDDIRSGFPLKKLMDMAL